MKRKYYLAFDIFLLFLLLGYAIHRDIQLIKLFPADLRNRVVGARLIDDGKLPYFYKWKKGDDTRYLDYNNYSGVKFSNMTASPFMHQLMIPFSRLPQKTISAIWLFLEYVFLAIIILSATQLCIQHFQKLLVLHAGILFLYTEAWLNHIYVGQIYLLVAALSAMAGFLLVKHRSTRTQALAGLLTLLIMLIRPMFIVFLIPFLFYFSHKRSFLVSTLVLSVLYGILLFISSWQRSLWLDYKSGLGEHIKMHQGEKFRFGSDESLPRIRYFEGYDMDEIRALTGKRYYIKRSENGNVFVLFKLITGKQLSLFWLNTACILFVMLLYWRYDVLVQHSGFDTLRAVLFGLALYMIMEVFLPIHRHQYNTVQFFPILLFFFATVQRYASAAFIFAVAGLLLNLTNTPLIPLRHTIGEAFILFAILFTVYKRTKENLNGPNGDNHWSWISRINGSI